MYNFNTLHFRARTVRTCRHFSLIIQTAPREKNKKRRRQAHAKKELRKTDWITGIQNAVDYIEDNITEELDLAVIAQKAACSSFYFQRIFGILCGLPLSEYIRLRRLTLAGSELSQGNARVIDTALKYGYDSPESFARAFVRFHGIAPSQAKKDGSALRSFSRVSVQIILKGGNIMDYMIMKKEAFKVLEKVERHSIDDGQNKNTIPDFWTRSHADGTVPTLLAQASDRKYIFGICYGNQPSDCKTFDYSIAAPYGGGDIPDGYRVTEIPQRTWAVFGITGAMPKAVQETWHRICSEFFPASGYTPTYEMDIEAYTNGDMSSLDYKSEIWVPVEKAEKK